MAIIKVSSERKTMHGMATRVGCKRSAPTRESAPPVKKRKEKKEASAGTELSVAAVKDRKVILEPVEAFLSSIPQNQKEEMPDLQPKKTGDGNNTISISTEENWRMSVQCDNSDSQFDTCVIPDSYVPVLCSYFDSCGVDFSADGGNCSLQDSHSQCSTNWTHFSANGGEYDSAEGCDENEDSSDIDSHVDRWTCRVCKVAAVSIAVLPCSHLCLCWECESETDSCPICGEAKADCFYIRSD